MGGTALIHSVEYVTYDHYVLFWGAGLSCLNLKVEDLQSHDCSNNKQNQRLILIIEIETESVHEESYLLEK